MPKTKVIAEIGHNHQGKVDVAAEMIKAAHAAGAWGVKLQKRDNKTLFHPILYNAPYASENSYGATYGEHREALELSPYDFQQLQEYAKALGIVFGCTAFDLPSVAFLAGLRVDFIKIASACLTDHQLLDAAAKTKIFMMVSTGGATIEQIIAADKVILRAGVGRYVMFKANAAYPAAYSMLNLEAIPILKDQFPHCIMGFSDHSNGIAMPLAAAVVGAEFIEKHFTLDRTMRGTDHAMSLEPQGMRKLVRDLARWDEAQGIHLGPYPEEFPGLTKMGKSLYAIADIAPWEAMTAANVAMQSPKVPDALETCAPVLRKMCALVGIKKGEAIKKEMVQAWQ